ncbi:uncharacterized protein LOC128243997 [Mya arenaria]|uniref:uncharacterized protein LOC128243997 n=1 Tax=Mya arenaria TaxID=6604 RepID=UPI0022E82B35|nr:uncharacterized protein LOC128243997 [Mya arenaria]
MSHFVNEKDLRPLVATVVQTKEETKYAGRQKFVVELRTTQRDLGQELVWRQLAKHTPDCTKYTFLLPRSTPGKRVFPSRLHKIPGLCFAVYWEKDLCKATKLAEELHNILSECLGSSCYPGPPQERECSLQDSIRFPASVLLCIGKR